MLTGIRVENYRGIRLGEVHGFSRVNLFVGPNGSGKSALLESIFLGCMKNNPWFNARPSTMNNQVPLISQRHNEHGELPNPNCWHRRDTSKPLAIRYWSGPDTGGVLAFEARPDGALSSQWSVPMAPALADWMSRVRLLDIRLLLDDQLERNSWEQLLDRRGDRELIRVMNETYGVEIETFTYAGNKLKALFKDRDHALNLDDLGTGMRLAFRVFTSLLLCPKSGLLIEEFDAYQHPESLTAIAGLLVSLSQKSETQLFLTTHSMEAVRCFASAAKTHGPDLVRAFQFDLTDDGELTTATLSQVDVEVLVAGGIDLRRTR